MKNIIKRIFNPIYSNDKEKKEKFNNLWDEIKSTWTSDGFRWSNEWTVETYKKDNEIVELWTNQDYGVRDEIMYLDEEE